MSDHAKGLLITTLGVLFVVPDSLFIRLIDAAPLTIAFWRQLLTGCVILAGLVALQGPRGATAVFRMGPLSLVYAFFLGLSGVLFVSAVSLTSVANVVFIIATLPVFAALFSRIFLAEPVGRRTVATMAATALGLCIIAYGSGETEGASLAGDLLALCVAASFAMAMTTARRLRARSMVPAIPLASIGAALLLWPFAEPMSVIPAQWPLVALHGGVFITISTALLTLGPRYITSAEVGLLVLLESVLAPLLVWAVLDENPGPWALVGGAVVLGALFTSNLVALARARRRAAIR